MEECFLTDDYISQAHLAGRPIANLVVIIRNFVNCEFEINNFYLLGRNYSFFNQIVRYWISVNFKLCVFGEMSL